jgi:hypothetical protein
MHFEGFHQRVWMLLLVGLTLFPAGGAANSSANELPVVGSPADRAADFDQLWREISENYVYLGNMAASWAGARARYATQIAGVRTLDEWTSVLARALSELADFHMEVDPPPKDDWRPVPTCAMIWAEWRDGRAFVTGVQRGSHAAKAGVMPGDVILSRQSRNQTSNTIAGRAMAR